MLNKAVSRSQNYILPAPTGGLNQRDGLDGMPASDAIVMDNYYPAETKVCLRGGYKLYALKNSGLKTETLIPFRSPGHNRLFAAAGGKIINVTSGGSEVEVENLLGSRWPYVQFRNRLLLVNGVDEPLSYLQQEDGSWVWQQMALEGEGLDKSMLNRVAVSKQRVFYVEKNSSAYWYSEGVGEVQGNLCRVDLSALISRGGSLAAVAGWTRDGGEGMDDMTVFITTEGEVLVYTGSDPGNADDWSLKGKYYISRPVGEYCTMQYRGDIVVICEEGYLPLSSVIYQAEAGTSGAAYSDKIRGLVLERVKSNKNLAGWQSVIYPRGGYALFNVPVRGQFEQHVVNMSSGAWCRFTNVYALCWCLFEGRLFFGSDSGVFLFDEGHSDDGRPILGNVHQAYCSLGSPNLKKIQMLNPRTKSSSSFALNIYTNMDFNDEERSYAENIGHEGGFKWNGSKWSSLKTPTGTKWATLKGSIRSRWIGNNAAGFKASVVFKTKTRGNLIEWYNTGFRFETGGGVV